MHTKCTSVKIHIVSLVLHLNKLFLIQHGSHGMA